MRSVLSSPGDKQDSLYFALDDGDIVEQRTQTAIVQKSGLIYTGIPARRQSAAEIEESGVKARDYVRIPRMWGFSIEGDGESEGVSTFPWRFFATWQSSDHVMKGFESFYHRLKDDQVPGIDHDQDENTVFRTRELFDSVHASDVESLDHSNGVALTTIVNVRPPKTWDWRESPESNLRGTYEALHQYLGIDIDGCFTAYPEWEEIGWDQWMRFIIANLSGLAIQWGTSGPAIYVMYFSPPVVSLSSLSRILRD
jgi:hypothetical protein